MYSPDNGRRFNQLVRPLRGMFGDVFSRAPVPRTELSEPQVRPEPISTLLNGTLERAEKAISGFYANGLHPVERVTDWQIDIQGYKYYRLPFNVKTSEEKMALRAAIVEMVVGWRERDSEWDKVRQRGVLYRHDKGEMVAKIDTSNIPTVFIRLGPTKEATLKNVRDVIGALQPQRSDQHRLEGIPQSGIVEGEQLPKKERGVILFERYGVLPSKVDGKDHDRYLMESSLQ